jgi:predicted MFS family arabinose efflux permease
MGLTTSIWIWTLIWLVSGISSRLAFVLVSSIVLDMLASNKCSKLSGVMYVCLGLGVTGLIVPLLGHSFGWRGTWFGLMILTILVGFPTMIWLRKDQGGSNPRPTQTTNVEENTAVAETASFFPWLTIAYGSEGLGIMTVVYGVGQIVGAPGAGILAHGSRGFKVPTIIASGLLCIGIIIILAGKVLSNQQA